MNLKKKITFVNQKTKSQPKLLNCTIITICSKMPFTNSALKTPIKCWKLLILVLIEFGGSCKSDVLDKGDPTSCIPDYVLCLNHCSLDSFSFWGSWRSKKIILVYPNILISKHIYFRTNFITWKIIVVKVRTVSRT